MADSVLRFDFLATDKASPTFEKISKESDGLGGKVTKFGGAAVTALKLAGGAMVGLGVAGAAMGVKTAASMEQAQVGFTTLLGSGQKAKAFLADLTKFAAATPFELSGLVESSRTLIGVGLSAKDTKKALVDFGDAASAVGIDQAAFQRIMLATSQAISAGKFQAGDLNQIATNGIPIWKILSQSMGKSVPQLRQMASQGKLLSATVLPALEKQMHVDYGGAMAKQSETLNGLWSTFTDTLNLGLAKAITPIIPMLKTGIADASNIAAKALAKLPDVLDVATTAFKGAGKVIKGAQPIFAEAWKGIGSHIPNIDLSGLGKDLGDQAKHWGGRISGGIALGIHFGDWGPLLKVASDAITGGFTTIGNKLDTQVSGWPGRLLGSLQLGFAGGGWGPLGTVIGDGLLDAVKGGAKIGIQLGTIIGGWFTSIDWFGLGESVGKQAIPFIVGFSTTMLDGFITVAKQHPLDTALFIISLIPLGKFAAAFGPLRDLIEHLPLGEWFTKMLDHSAVPVFDGVKDFIVRFFKLMGEGFTDSFPALSKGVDGLFTGLADTIRLKAMYAAEAAGEYMDGLARGIGSKAADIVKWGGQIVKDLTAPYIDAGKWLVSRGKEVLEGLTSGLAEKIGPLVDTVNSAISKLRAPFDKAASWLVSKGTAVITGLRTGISDAGTALGNTAEKAIHAVVSPFSSAGKWLVTAGTHLLAGLRDGMVAEARLAGSWAASVGGKIVSAVKGYFGIHSPSTVFATMGSHLMQGLILGMVQHSPEAIVDKVFGSMPKALGAIVDKGLIKVAELPGKALNTLEGLGGKFAGLFGGGGKSGSIKGLSAAESWIVDHESGNRTTAQNPTSTAFGLGQLLIANREHYGAILGVPANTTNYAAQLSMFRMYVRDRYGTAERAEAFWKAHGWYDEGGMAMGRGWMAKNTLEPERVLSGAQTKSFDQLVQYISRPQAMSSTASRGPDMDYQALGEHVVRAFIKAGVSVTMDGSAIGRVIGKSATLLGRT
jgi:tape measure domain-containing protein